MKAAIGQIEIHYESHGEGRPLLLIHGLATDRLAWMFQVQGLRQHLQLINFDSRDAGRSSRVGVDYSTAEMAQDVVGLIDSLGLDQVHVAGASMGGAVAQQLTLLAPERVKSLALLGSFHYMREHEQDALNAWIDVYGKLPRADLMRVWLPVMYSSRFQAEQQDLFKRLMEFTINNPDAPDAASFGRQARAAIGHDLRGRLADISVPTLVVAGGSDTITPVATSEEIADIIPAARFEVVPDAGHAFFFEQPDRVNNLLQEFISGV